MAFQVFRADQHPFEVSTLTVDQIPWFKGNEVATCLGYARPRKAVYDNVDKEDKKTYEALMEGRPSEGPPSNQQPHEIYVNESGLYSLVLRSKKEEAKAFKRRVTSKVLPGIRQNGS